MIERLPFPPVRTVEPDCMGAKCPWCAAEMEAAAITLESLIIAHQDGQLDNPQREPDGTAPDGAVVLECPSCAKPSMLRLWWSSVDGKLARLIPVRTAKDAKFLSGGGHV